MLSTFHFHSNCIHCHYLFEFCVWPTVRNKPWCAIMYLVLPSFILHKDGQCCKLQVLGKYKQKKKLTIFSLTGINAGKIINCSKQENVYFLSKVLAKYKCPNLAKCECPNPKWKLKFKCIRIAVFFALSCASLMLKFFWRWTFLILIKLKSSLDHVMLISHFRTGIRNVVIEILNAVLGNNDICPFIYL